MTSGVWGDDIDGMRIRVEPADDGGELVMVSRWSFDTEEYIESRVCSRRDVGRILEEMRPAVLKSPRQRTSQKITANDLLEASREKA